MKTYPHVDDRPALHLKFLRHIDPTSPLILVIPDLSQIPVCFLTSILLRLGFVRIAERDG
jgi:hypothetical protein